MTENAGLWEPPDGWNYKTMRHVSHECGWTYAHPDWDVGGFTLKVQQHAADCPWPDIPPPVETVSD